MSERIPNSVEERVKIAERILESINSDETLRRLILSWEQLFIDGDRALPEHIIFKIGGEAVEVSVSTIKEKLYKKHPEWKEEEAADLFPEE